MGVRFISGGALTTIQDMGRFGYQETGMPVSGVMDQRSAALANLLVGKQEEEAVLEITMLGPSMEFTEDIIIAVTGADLGAKLDKAELPRYQAVLVRAGQTVSFAGIRSGSRAYVAFAGGLKIPMVMGSRSTNLKSKIGGFEGRKIGAGDEIPFAAPKTFLLHMADRKLDAEDFSAREHTLRVVMGPQDDYFTEQGIETFLTGEYTISNEYDRMGCRMQGPVIEHKNGGDIITDGISFGSVQVPSHGNPIVMMADHQTTGGYTKIASVITTDLPILAQSMPGHKIHFQKISIEEAQEIFCAWKQELKALDQKWNTAPEPASDVQAAALSAAVCEHRSGYAAKSTYRVVVNGEEFLVELEREEEPFRE